MAPLNHILIFASYKEIDSIQNLVNSGGLCNCVCTYVRVCVSFTIGTGDREWPISRPLMSSLPSVEPVSVLERFARVHLKGDRART